MILCSLAKCSYPVVITHCLSGRSTLRNILIFLARDPGFEPGTGKAASAAAAVTPTKHCPGSDSGPQRHKLEPSARPRVRTGDLWLRRPTLYPAELAAQHAAPLPARRKIVSPLARPVNAKKPLLAPCQPHTPSYLRWPFRPRRQPAVGNRRNRTLVSSPRHRAKVLQMQDIRSLNEMIRNESQFVDAILEEMKKVVVGQQHMVERLLIGMLTGGHVLLEGVPGLAKTLTVKTLARCLSINFQRIQFTPDLLPADILGTMIYNPRDQTFGVKKGPIFTNLVLADEINRAPAKVQSALLEAMQEHQITIGETTFPLSEPFLVLATQNPIEQEGTYPLPEAQVDRFMLMVKVGYPSKVEERAILESATSGYTPEVRPILDGAGLMHARNVVRDILIDDKLKHYIVDIVFASRDPKAHGMPDLAEFIQFGASPRATIFLVQAAKAHAFLRHRAFVIPEDIKAVGLDVLRHRVLLTYQAEAEQLTSDDVVQRIFDRIAVP